MQDILKQHRLSLTVLAAIALDAYALNISQLGFDHVSGFQIFMGLFLTILALFKLLSPTDMTAAFREFDWVSERVPLWADAFPYVEFALGWLLLANMMALLVHFLVFVMMLATGYGLYLAVAKKKGDYTKISKGKLLDAPFGLVTIVEVAAMGVLALYHLV